MFKEIAELIESHDTIIIHRHKNPDGDALGSQIGLCELIKHAYPNKKVYAVGDSSSRFSFMTGSVMNLIPDSAYKDALAIILDTASAAMISDGRYKTAEATARIDHHVSAEKICDVEVIDSSYESCCGLIAELARECSFGLTPIAAKSLYTGMVTDSGRFRYDSVSSRTHELAAFLMSEEFDTGDIYSGLYADDFRFIRLRAQFTLKIQFYGAGIAYIYTPLEEAKSYGFDNFTLSRGMVNTMGDIRGIDAWANFTETEDGVLCELRSSKYNVNAIAARHGGGGHTRASGATLASRSEAMEILAELSALTK